MGFFRNDETILYFETHGNGDPLLIIPGGGADGRYYLPIVNILKNNYQVILPDPRGCGRSEKGHTPYSFDLLVSDVIALLDHLNIPAAHVIGHSMGGMVAQHLAYQYPKRVRKLSLLATSAILSAFGRHCCKTAILAKTEASLKTFIHVMAIWNFSNAFFQKEENINNLLSGAAQDPYPLQSGSLIEQMKIICTFDSSSHLKDITNQTLIIGCEKDIMFPVEDVKMLASMIQNAEYREIQGAAHSVHIEQAEYVAEIFKQFIR